MIYVIEEGLNGHIKIGYARRPDKRKLTLQNGNSNRLTVIMTFEGDPSLENKIHKDLSKYKVREDGEWFYRNEKVFAYLNSLSPIEPKTEMMNGEEFIALWRDSEDSPTDYCPFCGERHTHGQGDGHRASHCALGNPFFTRKSDGKIFEQKRGYIVRTYKKAHNSRIHTDRRSGSTRERTSMACA